MGVVICLQASHRWTDIKEQMAIQKGMKNLPKSTKLEKCQKKEI